MVKKAIGYIIAIIGLLAIALTFPQVSSVVNLPLPEQLDGTILLIGGIILVVVGVLLALKSGKRRQKATEVPIYQGKDIVGYRRN